MVASPKFPRECDSEYMLTKKAQEAFTDHAFLLTMPISEFAIIQRHIDCIPEHELMTRKPEEVYRDIKDALYNVMTNKDESIALPSNIQPFIQRVYSYFTLRKTETNFIKEYTHAQDEMEPRWTQRKVAKERQQAYAQAQHLGNVLTMKGLDEFRDQFITAEGSDTPSMATAESDTPSMATAESNTPSLAAARSGTTSLAAARPGTTSMAAAGSDTPPTAATESDTPSMAAAESGTPSMAATESDTPPMAATESGSSTPSMAAAGSDTPSIRPKKSCTLQKNKKKITIFHPTAFLTSPDKPKIQQVDRDAIKEFCDIAMEFLVHTDKYEEEEAIEDYKSYAADQDRLASFNLFPGVKEFIAIALKAEKEGLVQALWNSDARLTATGPSRTLMDIIAYTLTDFTSNCKQPALRTSNHERTPFVKSIVPMFKYLAQESGLIEFGWCEKGLQTYGLAALESNDFALNQCDKKYADALGKNTMTDNEEFFIESSSGFDKENVNHSLDDTLKLLSECSNALLHIVKQHKKASIQTMSKKCVFGVQVIKQTLTLTKVSLSKSGKWKLVEVRSATAPTTWEQRNNWNPLFEMLATLYHELLQQRKLDMQISNEVCGLTDLGSESVVKHFSQ